MKSKQHLFTIFIVLLALAISATAQAAPPVALCQSVMVEAGPDCQADASIDNGSYDPDGDPITIDQFPPGPYPLGETVVELTVTDSYGNEDSCQATVTVVDTTPPVAACQDVLEEAGPGCEADASIDDGSYDPSGCPVTLVQNPAGPYPLGETVVELTVTDSSGNEDSCTATVTVVDTTPPVVDCLTYPDKLFPRNNQMVFVDIFVEASDICTQTSDLGLMVTVESSDPDDTKDGEEKFMGDVDGNDGYAAPFDVTPAFVQACGGFLGSIELRAECVGKNDRVYTVTTTVTDSSGNEMETNCFVLVQAKGKGKP